MTPGWILKQWLALASVSLICVTGLYCQVEMPPQKLSEMSHPELEAFCRNTLTEQQFVALGACLIKNDRIVWEGYYGLADREERTPLARENIFQLSSLSKTVTALAVLMLHEEGRFGLDDDVNTHMPLRVFHPRFHDKPITFRMLLNHTSGLADVTPTGLVVPKNVGRPPTASGDSDMSLADYVTGILTPAGKYYSEEYFSPHPPGTQYSYSNIGYALLGYLVETIAGQDFAEYTRRRILEPLEMHATGWYLRDLDTARVVFAYSFSPTDSIPQYRKIQHFGVPGYPAGMLRTTMRDFSAFLEVLMNNGRRGDVQVIRPKVVELMLGRQGMVNVPSRSFKFIDRGLGWNIVDVEGSPLYTMNGFSGGIFTDAYFSPQEKGAILYYFTGINMKNMAAIPGITRTLHNALRAFK